MITIQGFSPPLAARPFRCEVQTWQPAAARSAPHTKRLRTAVGSEESRKNKNWRPQGFSASWRGTENDENKLGRDLRQ